MKQTKMQTDFEHSKEHKKSSNFGFGYLLFDEMDI